MAAGRASARVGWWDKLTRSQTVTSTSGRRWTRSAPPTPASPGHDHRLTDLSPEGYAALADLDRRTLAQLDLVTPADERERVAKEAMQERLGLALEMYDAGVVTSEVNVITGALHAVRSVFDLMPTAGEEAAAAIAARMAAVPAALAQTRRTLLEAAEHGHVSARHQMLEVAKQCDIWVAADGDDFWPGLARRVSADTELPDSLAADLERDAAAARTATADFARFLRDELAPLGRATPGGRARALRAGLALLPGRHRRPGRDLRLGLVRAGPHRGRHALGGRQDRPRWDRRRRGEGARRGPGPHHRRARRRSATGCRAWPTGPSPSCTAPTSTSPSRCGASSAASRRPPTAASTTPARARTSAGPAACGGRCPQGIDSFSTWQEVTTVYHEGVPGHHLQIGADRRPGGAAQPVAAAAVLVLRARRGLGAVRRAAHGRAGLPRRPGRQARHARRAGDCGRPA